MPVETEAETVTGQDSAEVSAEKIEQSVFHEIDVDNIDRPRGMDITVVTSATNDDEGRALLRGLGFPFKEN